MERYFLVRQAAKQDDESTAGTRKAGRAGSGNVGPAWVAVGLAPAHPAAASGYTPLHVGDRAPFSAHVAGRGRGDPRARAWTQPRAVAVVAGNVDVVESVGRGRMGARISASVAYAAYPLGPAAGTDELWLSSSPLQQRSLHPRALGIPILRPYVVYFLRFVRSLPKHAVPKYE